MKKKISQRQLITAAIRAAQKSHSPYSRFPVGAALLASDGTVFTGCNVENASYGLTLCAERVAVVKAVSEGHKKFKALAVVGGKDKAIRPCGACLQVLAEFCGPDFPIVLVPLDAGRPRRSVALQEKADCLTLRDLLPQVFSL